MTTATTTTTTTTTMRLLLALLLLFVSSQEALSFQVGSKVPPLTLHWGFNPVTKVQLASYVAGQSVLVLGVPGAFLPSSKSSVVSYLENQGPLKELGIENVIVVGVNDGAVMGIWNKQIVEQHDGVNSLLTFLGDPAAEFIKKCRILGSDDEPESGLYGRCRHFCMWVENNIVKHIDVGVGDEGCGAPAIVEAIQTLQAEQKQLVSG
mmetsp:Transcript_27119/g.41618  ORF Transcript_27119/g.41618 Transcript_27119/m.41618 type:complete len:207 (+) Transcript_27119:49-669(+)